MPTPVGPVPRDPNDPDLWDEWYDPDDDAELPPPRHRPWWIRAAALVLLVGFVILFVMH